MRSIRKAKVGELKASAAAAGVTLALAQASAGADLDTNLVVNGEFENVDPLTTTEFGNSLIEAGWTTDSGGNVFAYNYAQNYDNRNPAGDVPPGNEASSSTDYYFSMNGDQNLAAVQNIDLSTGATASLIASGRGLFDLEGYFTTYAGDVELGTLTLEFYDGDPGFSGFDATLVGEQSSYVDPLNDEWSLIGGTGEIPATAKWARIVLNLDPALGSSGGPDVYVDNVSFVVSSAGGPGPEMTGISVSETGVINLTWSSNPDSTYKLDYSSDLEGWTEFDGSVDSGGAETRFDIPAGELTGDRLFFRVTENQ